MTHKRLQSDVPATYRVYVQGILDERWSDRMGDVTITTTGQASETPVTILGRSTLTLRM